MLVVVLHRERSEKLARHLVAALGEADPRMDSWPDLDPAEQEGVVRAFDSLIQEGLICEEQHRPEGRD